MCRLLAYAAPRQTTTAEVIGRGNALRFQNMSHVHRDGWGTAWIAGQGMDAPVVQSERHSVAGRDDPELARFLHAAPSRARIAHLRLATASFAQARDNSHPFHAGGIAFAHNGTIVPVGYLQHLLHPSYLAGVKGDTDSELYFALIRQNARIHGSLVAGVAETVRVLRGIFPDASLNAMLLSPTELLAVRASSTSRISQSIFTERGIAPNELPSGHTHDYYAMSIRRETDGTTVLSSTGIDLTGWSEIPDNTITHVDLATLQLTQVPILFAGRSAARLAVAG